MWAVGGYNSGGQALIEHWDGAAWNVVTNPNPGTYNRFFGVAAISSQNVWAVGQFGNGGYIRRWWSAGMVTVGASSPAQTCPTNITSLIP